MRHWLLTGMVYCLMCALILVGMKLVAAQQVASLDHTNEPQYECTPECKP